MWSVQFNGPANDWASIPDNAAFSALTDFSCICRVNMTNWNPSGAQAFMGHYDTNPVNSKAFRFLNPGVSSKIRLTLSFTGSDNFNYTSTVGVPFSSGSPWVGFTRASGTGTIKFYTAPDTGTSTPPAIGEFTQLGTNVAGATGAIYDSAADFTVGAVDDGVSAELNGRVYRAQLYSGIYGSGSETLLVDFDPTDSAGPGDTSWSDGTYTWTLNGGAAVVSDFLPMILHY